jgi:hypothetical protein
METGNSKQCEIKDHLWLIAINFNSQMDDYGDLLYMLFTNGENDEPLSFNNKICVFTESAFKKILNGIGYNFTVSELLNEIDLIYDIAKVNELILKKNIDNGSYLINWINISLDMLNSINIVLPDQYKKELYDFANHMTFHRKFGSYFKVNNVSREVIADAIYWINGAIFSNMILNIFPPKLEENIRSKIYTNAN